MRSLLHKFMERPLCYKRRCVLGLLRWLLHASCFDTRHPILLGSGVYIEKRYGLITTSGICIVGAGCGLGVVGQKTQPAHLHIGVGTEIGGRTIINVAQRVEIGSRCSISWDCDISDTDFHQVLLADGSRPPVSAPVIIEDHVWIGSHVQILKGVHIGPNAVIGAGSVVRRDVAPHTLVAGNPARPVAEIQGWER
jgi:acetyltransferase-like isoleucine patch superfamily enzyme